MLQSTNKKLHRYNLADRSSKHSCRLGKPALAHKPACHAVNAVHELHGCLVYLLSQLCQHLQAASKQPGGKAHTVGRLLRSKGQDLVGCKVWLFWRKHGEWYEAKADGFDPSTFKHT